MSEKTTDATPEVMPLVVQTQPQKKKNKTGTLFVIAIVVIGCIVIFEDDIRNITNLWPEDEVIDILEPADVQLYQFNDLVSNKSVNVEIWLINIGEETAKDISVYVRCRNQNGTILLSEEISLTALLLREDETCSGIYIISAVNNTKIYSTVEIQWDGGRIAYNKTTILD